MLKILSLKGEERLTVGKGPASVMRQKGMIPAVIYGGGKSNVMLSLEEKEITLEYNVLGFMSRLVDIEVGKNKFKVIPKAIQLHPVTDRIIHADFVHINENDVLKVSIPLHFINKDKCIGIKHGGVANILKHELEISCKANSIPDSISIDLTNVDVAQSVHVSDLILPNGVEATFDNNVTIATISGRAKEEAATEGTPAAKAPAAAK